MIERISKITEICFNIGRFTMFPILPCILLFFFGEKTMTIVLVIQSAICCGSILLESWINNNILYPLCEEQEKRSEES